MEQSFLLYMVLLLFVAKLLEKIFGYIRINPVVAYIIAGLVLGPAGLGIVNPLKSLEALSYLGLMLLIFYTGLTTSFNELKNASLRILVIGTSGILTTITICFLVLNSMGFDFVKSVIISVILSNT
ncbi:MAG: cation:proton antiporter, partial [Desulfurococcaceae archaeon]|nr:cation:proton antiporter [Desulfurococcaceae archaeon]